MIGTGSGPARMPGQRDMKPKQTVVVGVTGSIAACKAVDLVSQLSKSGVNVRVILTRDAQKFVTALPFKTLSRNAVITDLYDEEEGWKPSHSDVADLATLLVIAPATANTIARLAHGLADDALSCVALAVEPGIPILVAPAMNGKMWMHPATQHNVGILKSRGVEFIGPDEGMLSCGYEGLGRLSDPGVIAARVMALLG